MQTICYWALYSIRVAATDQLYKFLRVHLMAMRTGSMLLRHCAVIATIGNHLPFLRRLGK